MLEKEQFNYLSTYLLAEEAEKRGIKVSKIFKTGTFSKYSQLELVYKGHQEVIIGQRCSKTDCIGYWIAKNKEMTKYFLKKSNISVAIGDIFNVKNKEEIIKYCQKIKYPVVLKPISGTHGTKVFLGINNDKELQKVLKNFKTRVMIEKEHTGKEYRLLATRNKFLAAIHRIPANVVGDGIHNIVDLVALKNKDPRRGYGHSKSLVKIKIDKSIKNFLKQKKIKLSYVPKKDEVVYLRINSNISTGGDSIDVTNLVHPKVKKLAVEAIRAIPGLAYAGIDFLTKDVTVAPTSKNYIIIEVNDSPMLSMHHIPYQGASRNVSKGIIDLLFPETKK